MAHKLLVSIPPGPLTAAAQAKKRKASALGEEAAVAAGIAKPDAADVGGLLPRDAECAGEEGDDGEVEETRCRRLVVFAQPGQTVGNLKQKILAQYKTLFARDGTSVPKNIPYLKDADGFACDDGYMAVECFAPGSKVYAEKAATRSWKRKSRVRTNVGDEDDLENQPHQLQQGEDDDDAEEEEESTPEPAAAPSPPSLPPVPAPKEKLEGNKARKQKVEKGGKPEKAVQKGEKVEKKERKKRQQAADKSAAPAAPTGLANLSAGKPKKHNASPVALPTSTSRNFPSKLAPKKTASESENSGEDESEIE